LNRPLIRLAATVLAIAATLAITATGWDPQAAQERACLRMTEIATGHDQLAALSLWFDRTFAFDKPPHEPGVYRDVSKWSPSAFELEGMGYDGERFGLPDDLTPVFLIADDRIAGVQLVRGRWPSVVLIGDREAKPNDFGIVAHRISDRVFVGCGPRVDWKNLRQRG
jgi:hypothetical protein